MAFTYSNLHQGADFAYMHPGHPLSKSAHVNGVLRKKQQLNNDLPHI